MDDVFDNLTLRNDSFHQGCGNSSSLGGENVYDIDCVQNEPPSSFPFDKYGTTENISMLYITICLGLWSVVANGLPLAAIIKKEQLHKPVYILMANLAASDILAGVSFVIGSSFFLFARQTENIVSDALVRFRLTSILLSGLSSAYGLMALTAERYWFIVHGMKYVNNVDNDKCKVVIVVVWVWSTLIAVLPNFDGYCQGRFDERCIPLGVGMSFNYVIVVLVFVFIPMAAILFFNLRVLYCLWKHMNAIAAQEASVGAQPSINRKSAVTVIIITVMFLVGWLPLFVSMALFTQAFDTLTKMMVFVLFNSAVNPVIYAFRLSEVRGGVARLFSPGNANLAVH